MYCTACGTENVDEAQFCTRCGESMGGSTAPSHPPTVSPSTQINRASTATGVRTATLIFGLIAATMLFFGGCTAFVTGSFFEGVEEVFDTELDDPDSGFTSTTEDVSTAGAFAIFIAILLYLGAGLAKVALKTSLALLVFAVPMLVGLVVVDTTSLFATAYYIALVFVGVGVILRGIAQVEALLDEFGQAEMPGQGGRKEQPGIGHQAAVVEGDLDPVGVVE